MGSDDASLKPKRKQKREAEGDGRDLLVAYLSDVGGYDRNYRDVEDEDESGSSGNKINITIITYSLYYLLYGEQGCRINESSRLPPMLPECDSFPCCTGFEFHVGFRLTPKAFLHGFPRFLSPEETNIFKFQFDSDRESASE